MKRKILLSVSFIVLFAILILTAVSFHNKTTVSIDDITTTAVTDAQGETHYYTPATDKNGDEQTTSVGRKVYVEIQTEANRKYSVKDNTAVFETTEKKSALVQKSKVHTTKAKEAKSTTSDKQADNDIPFEGTSNESKTTKKSEQTSKSSTSPNTTKPVTDKSSSKIATDEDGWIDKWY